jgi:hypothetical protein
MESVMTARTVLTLHADHPLRAAGVTALDALDGDEHPQ